MSKIHEFVHKFKNGTEIRLKFDLSQDMPYCESNLKLDMQPVEILQEYRVWQNSVILPTIIPLMTKTQIVNMARYGEQLMNRKAN